MPQGSGRLEAAWPFELPLVAPLLETVMMADYGRGWPEDNEAKGKRSNGKLWQLGSCDVIPNLRRRGSGR